MELTFHPFQCTGAHGAAHLALRPGPHEVTACDLDRVVDEIVEAAARGATAVRGEAGWAWWQRLAAGFPNSPATHPGRGRDPERIASRVRALFGPDDGADPAPCWTCGRPATAWWGKSLWPLQEPIGRLNSGHPRGVATCRTCRIALWCLPFAAGYARGWMWTISGSGPLEEAFAAAQVRFARRALKEDWADWEQAPHPQEVLVAALADHPGPVQVQRWTNDNRNPQAAFADLSLEGSRWLAAASGDAHREAARRLARAVRTSVVDLAAMGPERTVALAREAGLPADATVRLRELADLTVRRVP